jgi:hypothetical protein
VRVTLFIRKILDILKHPDVSLEAIVDEWIELFSKRQDMATLMLINLIVQVGIDRNRY